MDKIYINEPIETKPVSLSKKSNEIINKYNDEQDKGIVNSIIYPNDWLDKDKQWQSRDVEMKDTREIYNHDFYSMTTDNMDGHMTEENVDKIGKSIREIYDENITDFKKLIPKKTLIDDTDNSNLQDGASGLSYITTDKWVYEDEKPENGGQIGKGLYAVDPSVLEACAFF